MDKRSAIASSAESRVGYGYIYGATGWVCTEARLQTQAKQYPAYADKIYHYGRKLWLGKVCYDCAQLTRRAAKDAGYTFVSGANSQWSMDLWAQKGAINTLPQGEVAIFLFIKDQSTGRMKHVAVTVGDGYAVEARGHAYGVVKRKVSDGSWTHWARLRDMEGEVSDPPPPTLTLGTRGDDVSRMQQLLMAAGYPLAKYGADGIFGPETLQAVKAFQAGSGLAADGIVGGKTWAALQTAGADTGEEGETAAPEATYSVCIGALSYKKAQELAALYPGADIQAERGERA